MLDYAKIDQRTRVIKFLQSRLSICFYFTVFLKVSYFMRVCVKKLLSCITPRRSYTLGPLQSFHVATEFQAKDASDCFGAMGCARTRAKDGSAL